MAEKAIELSHHIQKAMNSLLQHFLTPCGRVGRAAFWKRQALLALLLYPSIILTTLSYEALCSNSGWLIDALLLFGASAGCLLTLGAVWLALVTLFASFGLAPALVHVPESVPTLVWPMLVLCSALVLLATWSSLALVLRRLRDTRPGLWLLPLCLPLVWWIVGSACLKSLGWSALQEYHVVVYGLFWFCCLTSIICTCLPSRQE